MESAPFFTVIMPVYKTEAYLPAAVESVLRQSFTDFELILVDDCSPDGSGAICDAYADKDVRVRVIHLPQNGGASHARTVGFASAKGSYILFMDSDDTVSDTIMEAAHEVLRADQPQVLMFGAQEVYTDANGRAFSRVDICYPAKHLTTHEQVRDEVISIEKTTLFGYLWNKFYAAEVLRNSGVSFADMPLNEDFRYNIELFRSVMSLTVLDVVGYYYYKRENESLTGRFVADYFALQQARVQDLFDFYARENACTDAVKAVLGNIYVRSVFSALQRNCDPRAEMNAKARREWLVSQLQDPFFRDLTLYAAPEGRLAGVLCALLKKKRVSLMLLCARGIYFVKTKLPALFARAKQSR